MNKRFLMIVLTIAINFNAQAQDSELGDRFKIIDIMNSYALALDTKDYPLLRSLFSDDVEVRITFDSNFSGDGDVKFTGIDDWVHYVEKALDGTKASQHLLGNPIINFNGKTALVRTDLQATEFYMDVKRAKTTVWGFYDTHMVKDENWKITKHTLTSIGSE
tara:strand:+ start:431 stop:916 length:486 start_codon:yes stop_codon:yes gene_type:complete